MHGLRERPWGVAANNCEVFRYIPLRDEHRLGHCEWLPQASDLCVCVGHSGDCFHSFVALRPVEGGRWRVVGEFGAYGFGAKLAVLDKRAFHLAQAGEAIDMPPLGNGDEAFWKALALEFSNALQKLAQGQAAAAEAALEVLAPHGARDGASWEAAARRWGKALAGVTAGTSQDDIEKIEGSSGTSGDGLWETKQRADKLAAELSP